MDDYNKGTRNEKQTITTTSSVVLPINYTRKVLIIRNSSTAGQVITLNVGMNQAVANEGIVLAPGQSYAENDSESFECWKGQVQAISSAVDGVLSVFER